MKRPFSPVVWLCAALGAALSVLPVVDPNGVYAGYTAALSPETPVIAAVFTAARDGVYPWSVYDSPADIPYSPAYYRPLTGTVTDAEMRSSVGNDEPFPASEDTVTDVDEFTPSVEVVTPAAPMVEPESVETAERAQSAECPDAGFVAVDESWFDDAVFIGDSHTEGLCDYAGLRNATFYYKRGLDVWSVLKKPFVSGKLTIPQALEQHRFGKIYIMLGINEIGCGTTESFAAQYESVVAQLRELQPDALIYIQAIFHTSQKKSDTTQYNNERINARNEAISRIADGEHVFFVDCNAVFDDENGALTPTYTGDGVHVKAPYYTMWRDYLMRFGRAGVTTVEDERAPVPSSTTEPSAPAAAPVPAPKPVPTAPEDSSAEPAADASSVVEPVPESVAETAPEPIPDAVSEGVSAPIPESAPESDSENAPEAVEAAEAANAVEPAAESASEALLEGVGE
ncbi:MAG: hypothetical protein E7422_04680 [Ruminococcaceae bacterium]|jgi:hypothetical protein|nr:hypothetical protein [Oscillospiraceae bacterium]